MKQLRPNGRNDNSPSRNVKIALICRDLLASTFVHLTNQAYHCAVLFETNIARFSVGLAP